MKLDDIPQDAGSTDGGSRKLRDAADVDGRHQPAHSQSLETGSSATRQTLEAFEHLAQTAKQEWSDGLASPLKYLMYHCHLDEAALAKATGLWQWQVRRHFRAKVYQRLQPARLREYAQALGVPVEQLLRWQHYGAPDI